MNPLKLIVLVTLVATSRIAHSSGCEDLKSQAEVIQVEATSGAFTPPGGTAALASLPPFCRVVVKLRPSPDSDITSEVWLPLKWNSKLLVIGNGGWGGAIDYDGLAAALRRGYAAAATDDGHSGRGGSFALGHPQKLVDFAWRSEHETTLEAKRLIKTLYKHAASRSYWQGCSGGGREGLIQAYRYRDEFDGIIAGDPANIRRNAWALGLAVQTLSDPEAYIPPSKYPMIHSAVLAACDASDGLKDGLISDPQSCHPDFGALQCRSEDAPN